jgi:hypothetical protein
MAGCLGLSHVICDIPNLCCMASFCLVAAGGGVELIGTAIGGHRPRRCSRDRFPSNTTFIAPANSSTQQVFPHQHLVASIFSSPSWTSFHKYVRRGYLQNPNCIHKIHHTNFSIHQPRIHHSSLQNTTTEPTHLTNLTKLHYITAPSLPTHNTQNGRPQPR